MKKQSGQVGVIFVMVLLVIAVLIAILISTKGCSKPPKPTNTPIPTKTATNTPVVVTDEPTAVISPTLIIPTPTKPELTWEPTIVIPTTTPTPIIYTPVPTLPIMEYAVIKLCQPKFWYQVCYQKCCPVVSEK